MQTKSTTITSTIETVFNTGAMYGSEGQVFYVVYDQETGRIYFNDVSRGIRGVITDMTPGYSFRAISQLHNCVRRHYDDHNYDSPQDIEEMQFLNNLDPNDRAYRAESELKRIKAQIGYDLEWIDQDDGRLSREERIEFYITKRLPEIINS